MKYNDDDECYVLECSGREIRANHGILGLEPEGRGESAYYELTEGYDSHFWFDEDHDEGPLSAAERKEIAEFMVARWRKWGNI